MIMNHKPISFILCEHRSRQDITQRQSVTCVDPDGHASKRIGKQFIRCNRIMKMGLF